MAKVIRKWVNKKTGEIRTKTYEYAKKPKVNKVITKKGTLSKRIDSIIKEIEDVSEREYVKAKIKQYVADMEDGSKTKQAYILSSFRTMYEADRVKTFLDNMGIDINDLCDSINDQLKERKLANPDEEYPRVTEMDILNNNNWDWSGNKGKGRDRSIISSTLRFDKIMVSFTFQYLTHSFEAKVTGIDE